MISAFLSAFVFAYSTLVPVINPFSGAMFFTTMTRDVPDRDNGAGDQPLQRGDVLHHDDA